MFGGSNLGLMLGLILFRNLSRYYSRTPLIRPPSESHWCGRIRGMVAREGFVECTVRHTKCGRMRGMVVGEGGRSSGVLLYFAHSVTPC